MTSWNDDQTPRRFAPSLTFMRRMSRGVYEFMWMVTRMKKRKTRESRKRGGERVSSNL
jgi:hypothetical protein